MFRHLVPDHARTETIAAEVQAAFEQGRAVWENLVRNARDHKLPRFDALVRRWREEPLTTRAEKQWFVPGCYRQLDEVGAAAVFFPPAGGVREFLAIELTDGVPLRYPGRCALLEMSAEEANRRARLLGARFRFKRD